MSYTPGQGPRVIWKPSPSNRSKGPVVLVNADNKATPTITTADGKVITGKFLNEVEGARQFEFPRELVAQGNLNLNVGDASATIERGSVSYEGPPDLSQFNARSKGSVGYPTGINPGGMYGFTQQGFGVSPADLTQYFPDAEQTALAKFKFTDPSKYVQEYGKTATNIFKDNYKLSNDLALDSLDTELKGLQSFAPAAAALKRSLIAEDNAFNQQQRTQQVNTALPGVQGALTQQFQDAQTYASGSVPDSVLDAGLSLTARSRAADKSAAGGFGASSSVARRASDLMEAEDRIRLSQYGNQLLGNNIETQAALFLAPTQYSNAGAQINVNPSVSATQLSSNISGQLNSLNNLSASQALNTEVSQRTFDTNRRQARRDLNTQIQNNFNLQKFGYQVGYAGAVAGAGQTDINTQVGLQQQQQYYDLMRQYQGQSQNAGTIGSIFSSVGTLFGSGGGSSITDSIGSAIGKGGGGGGSSSSSFGGDIDSAFSSADSFSNFEIPDFSFSPF